MPLQSPRNGVALTRLFRAICHLLAAVVMKDCVGVGWGNDVITVDMVGCLGHVWRGRV